MASRGPKAHLLTIQHVQPCAAAPVRGGGRHPCESLGRLLRCQFRALRPRRFNFRCAARRPLIASRPQPQVRWEDQKQINEFGGLNNRRVELRAKVDSLKVRQQVADDYSHPRSPRPPQNPS